MLLNTSFKELQKPGLFALVLKGTNRGIIVYSSLITNTLTDIFFQLNNNTFRNREIQEQYNLDKDNNVEFHLLEYVEPGPALDLRLRYRMTKYMEAGMFDLLSNYKPISLKVSVKIYHGKLPQVVCSTGRYKKFFVQKPFAFVEEAEYYVNTTPMETILKETLGSTKPFKLVVKKET